MSEELTVLNPKRIRNRRVKVFGLMFVSTLLATIKWTYVIPTDSTLLTKFLMVALFVLTFAWIALFFWSSIFGFFELLFPARRSRHNLGSGRHKTLDPNSRADARLQRVFA